MIKVQAPPRVAALHLICFEESAIVFGAWWARNRDEHELLEEVGGLLDNGQLGVGATWVTPLAAARPEALPILGFHLDELEQTFGYRPAVAVLNDVPAFPEALVDALASRGIRYLLSGANMFISDSLPSHLVRRPFWWESASGARLLTYIDPGSYTTAFSDWGIDPRTAKAMAPDQFPAEVDDLHTMERGINAMIETVARDFASAGNGEAMVGRACGVLDARGPVHRRHRARDPAPAVLAVLDARDA